MAAGDLTTKANVRAFLQKQSGDTGQDAVIESLITHASALITRYTERQFVPEEAASHTFEFQQPWGSLLNLAPYELRSLTSIKLDPDSTSPTTLTEDEYRLWPKPNRDGTYLGIKLNPFLYIGPKAIRWGTRREVEITGNWGMTSIPEDVVHWANVCVVIWMRRDVSAFETGMKVDEGYVERPQALPSAVRGGLDLWKRRTDA